ncbi:MAG: DUF1330 domain-containing protein [Chromatiales bacterium]|jgi:uncharacterized protein (DUF1330 family)|nr:DUF1330 domain-containing protein [Chromatiales bacterium]
MAKGYFIANIDITDMDSYAKYREKVPATVEQFGGTYLVRGGPLESIEGDAPRARSVVLEFASVEHAKAWYNSDEYQAIVHLRLNASTGSAFVVEGI